MMAFWCALGAALSAIRRRAGWTAFLLVRALAGAYAFIASATRGGLVAVPVLIALAALALVRRDHGRLLPTGTVVLVAAVTLVVMLLPAGQITERRFDEAFAEWHAYSEQGDATNNVGSRMEVWTADRVNPFVVQLANTHNQFIKVWLHQSTLCRTV